LGITVGTRETAGAAKAGAVGETAVTLGATAAGVTIGRAGRGAGLCGATVGKGGSGGGGAFCASSGNAPRSPVILSRPQFNFLP
jgi:hypothetical protein